MALKSQERSPVEEETLELDLGFMYGTRSQKGKKHYVYSLIRFKLIIFSGLGFYFQFNS